MDNKTLTLTLKKIKEYDDASLEWRDRHKENGVPVDVSATFPHADKVTNELRSQVEVAWFVREKPTKYFLYINEKTKQATTWTGDVLGDVGFGRPWTSNFGDERVSVTIYAVNGCQYHGTYFKSSGNYARVRRGKTS